MDYDQTLQALETIEGTTALVYAAAGGASATEPGDFTISGGLWAGGKFKRDRQGETAGASVRRRLAGEEWYRRLNPELDSGDMPLEQYELQAAYFTFEGMDAEPSVGHAGFTLWRHKFVDSDWLEFAVRPDWLWIRSAGSGVVVVAEFPERDTS